MERKDREIRDAFELVGFRGRKADFIRLNRPYLQEISQDFEMSYKNVVFTHCLASIGNNIRTKEREIYKTSFGFKKFKNSLERFVESFNGRSTTISLEVVVRKTRDYFLAYFLIIQHSNTQQKRKSKPNPRNISDFFAICVSPSQKNISYYRGREYILNWLDWWFDTKLNVKLKETEFKKWKSSDFKKFLMNENMEIYEIGLRKTNIGIGDKVIIKSRKGEGFQYLEKLKDVLADNEITIYDVEYLVFSFKGGAKQRLKFKRKEKDFSISLDLSSKPKETIPEDLKNFVEYGILLFDEINKKEAIKQFIHKQYIDHYDYKNPIVRETLDSLKKVNIISVKKVYRYKCTSLLCPYDIRSSAKRICKCGRPSKKRFVSHYNIKINYKKIIALLGRGIRKYNFSYRVMPDGYLQFKNSPVIRIKNKQTNEYYYILLNEKGLNQEDIENLRINGIPMVIINLKGEITSTLSEFHTMNSGDLVFSLLQNDYSMLNNILGNLENKTQSLKLASFEKALEVLEKDSMSPQLFEKLVFSIFNFVFLECQRWGGPKLADGSFPLRSRGRVNYLIWDAKRYDCSSLERYVKRNALKKDIKYMQDFNDNRIINRFGSLRYYMFVTSKTDKEEFISVQQELKKQIKRSHIDKNLKRVNIVCINKDQLLKFASFIKNSDYGQILSNYRDFVRIIKKGFVDNNGYFDFDSIKDELNNLKTTDKIYPTAPELRT